jgi:hypothetical protein
VEDESSRLLIYQLKKFKYEILRSKDPGGTGMALLVLKDILSLVGVVVNEAELGSWRKEHCEKAREWAVKSYLRASDHKVRVPPKPDFLNLYPTAS